MKCQHQNGLQLINNYQEAKIYYCPACQLTFSDKFLKPLKPEEIYNNYYKKGMAGRFNFGLEFIIKLFRLYRAFKIFTIYPKAKSILDIGSGRGYSLYFLKKIFKYQRAAGTQIEPNAFRFSKEKLKLEIYNQDLLHLNLPQVSFDIISLWHVFEHLQDPETYLIKIFELLKANGKLIIEVPNYNSWTRKYCGPHWLGLDLNYHLTFFDYKTLANLLEKYGFKNKLIHTFSLEYSTFISVQSIISRLTNTDQLIFNWLQGKNKFQSKMLWHLLLFILLTPACFLVNLFLFISKKGETLLIVAKKITVN